MYVALNFKFLSGILRVMLCDDSQSVLIGGDNEKAVQEVEQRVQGKIYEYYQSQEFAGRAAPFTKSLPIPDNVVLFSLVGIKELQSIPGILFIKVKEGMGKIGGDENVVEDVFNKIKEILSRFNLNNRVISKQIHYDMTTQFSGKMSFHPILESNVVDFTAFLPSIKVDNAKVDNAEVDSAEVDNAKFFHFSEDQHSVIPCVLDPNYSGKVSHCFFDMEIIMSSFREILASSNFHRSGSPRIEVKLGLTAFYSIALGSKVQVREDGERKVWVAEDLLTREEEEQWHYKTQFSGSLKIPLSDLQPVLLASGFEKKETESHITVHLQDLDTAMSFTATLVEEGDTMQITSLQERKTKHLTVDIVKPNGKIGARTVLLSENPVQNESAKAFLTSAWEAGWLLEGTHLTSDRNFGVENVRVVNNTVFWDGEYGLYLEEVEEKATHTRGCFVRGVELVLTRPALNKKLAAVQESGAQLEDDCCRMLREVVERGRTFAEQLQN